jgi:hypothetical protein
MVKAMVPDGMAFYRWATLARPRTRSGDRVAIAAYLGPNHRFDNAIVDFTETYAGQNERDHTALVDAVATGRLTAQTGV